MLYTASHTISFRSMAMEKDKTKTPLEKELARLDAAYKKKKRMQRMRMFLTPEKPGERRPLPYKDDD